MIIIPARIASTRFPRKVLYEIDGLPMVIRTALQAKEVDDVVIATDSQEVIAVAKNHGFDAVLTSATHASGTDRINEAATILGVDQTEIILNVQADEPFIEPEVIKTLQELTQKHRDFENVMMCTLYKSEPYQAKDDPNRVKVVVDGAGYALYFSRSQIPYPRSSLKNIKIHLGLYGYTKKMLERFCALQQAPLEEIEKLEQLRALYHGYKIAIKEVKSQSIGIDTPEDLQKL
ncbi:3-deoxy-manno-octulosonate cytidylyltransferase [Nitratiruptor tergarcus]|uniref:3-deoxy-manno-octulosonate cytidylyltransferase (CMP-KDO synthetase) n=1 Tax=Nitratiruptor tergarcus DSM 16512 TaxID=1069081 RepID=A0A1W1WTX8_9BACT|nr:3-deoxy-manno-octulosonate cytidylyltransferase [Nitratiruptor tergarcus]SMC09645.1 3-deoxy-manno-octulosonate cytidylyltransferase (CMP-KDO synthetase) [Nitratiruptor tergarcus DSM 16512]